MATAEQVESLVQAAVAKVGDGNVDNRLQVDDGVAEADWLPSVGGLTGALPVGAALKLGAEQLMLSGEADSDAEIDQLGEMAKQAISGSELQLANNLQLSAKAREAIEAAARKAAEEEARKQAEAEAANKAAEEEEARKQVEAEAAKKAAAEEEARKQAEAEAAKKAAAEEEARKQAEAEAAKKAAEEEARKQAEAEAAKKAAAEEDARKQAEAEAEAAKKAAVEEEARKQAEAEAAKKAAAEEEARKQAEAAQQACQNKLNSAMTGKKILFATNKADINPESYPLLNNLADIVNECSAGLVGRRIVVGGHTDNSGASDYNQSLSQRRAEAVVSYLQGKNISTGLLESRGFGETQPAATNDTEEGKAQNRRITFEIKQK
ncbi:MAG: OmpA family protein [Thiolinea sp.]